jgi:hypothetical protein
MDMINHGKQHDHEQAYLQLLKSQHRPAVAIERLHAATEPTQTAGQIR